MKNSRVIVWRITQDCHMQCKFCSYSTHVQRQRDHADEEEVLRLCGVLADYKAATGEDMLVSWIGGEPFLWKNIIPRSKLLHEHGISVSTTTNGQLLSDPSLLADVATYFSEVVFSVDSFEDCHDDVRGCKGSFRRVTESIQALDKIREQIGSSLKIKVNTILMRRNIREFEPFCHYLRSLGVDEVTFNQLGGYDRPEFFDDNRLLLTQVMDFTCEFPRIKSALAHEGLIIHGSPLYLQRFITAAQDIKNPVSECHPGSWFWFINENGFISPCSYTSYEYKFSTKDLRTPEDIPKVEAYFRDQRKNARSKWCDDCYCTQVYDKFG